MVASYVLPMDVNPINKKNRISFDIETRTAADCCWLAGFCGQPGELDSYSEENELDSKLSVNCFCYLGNYSDTHSESQDKLDNKLLCMSCSQRRVYSDERRIDSAKNKSLKIYRRDLLS